MKNRKANRTTETPGGGGKKKFGVKIKLKHPPKIQDVIYIKRWLNSKILIKDSKALIPVLFVCLGNT